MLYGSYSDFHTRVLSPERLEAFVDGIEQGWGIGASPEAFAPSRTADREFRAWWARFERVGASPAAAITLMRMNAEIDIRAIVPAIRVPTLVLHRTGDPRVNVAAGRLLGSRIPGARYIEVPGGDHLFWSGDTDRLLDEIALFRSARPAAGDSKPCDG